MTISKGKIDLRLDYPARAPEAKARIRLKVSDPGAAKGYRVHAETDEGWNSGLMDLEAQTDVGDVPLKKGENRIRLKVVDQRGVAEPSLSHEIVIQRVEASADGMPLMHSIAVKIMTGAIGAETNELGTLVDRGTLVPKSGCGRFRAAKDLRHGHEETIEIS